MNALDYLKAEHVKAKATFKKIETAPAEGRQAMWAELQRELEVHEQIEQLHVYGPVARTNAAKGTKLEDWDSHHTEEVDEVKAVIATMEGLDPATDEWLQNLLEVRSMLDEHIREEESEIWPEITRVWDSGRLDEAGAKMEKTHDEKLKVS